MEKKSILWAWLGANFLSNIATKAVDVVYPYFDGTYMAYLLLATLSWVPLFILFMTKTFKGKNTAALYVQLGASVVVLNVVAMIGSFIFPQHMLIVMVIVFIAAITVQYPFASNVIHKHGKIE